MNLIALKNEITTDPLALGYVGKNDEEVADLLNKTQRPVDRETLDGGLLVASIVRSEYAALSATDKDYVRLVALASSIPLTATIKTELGQVFPAGSQTRANLVALLKRTGSRAEELGLGFVTPSHVADARRL